MKKLHKNKTIVIFSVFLTCVVYNPSFGFFGGELQVEPERPNVRFDDLVGAKTKEVEELIQQIKDPNRFVRVGVEPPNAVLLYGKSGTGKTTLARAIAHELDTYLFAISGSDIKSRWVGGEKDNINSLFESAREYVQIYEKKVVVLMDEMDGVLGGFDSGLDCGAAKEAVAKLKYEITNDANKGIIVIATTNHIDMFPKALIRSGRFMTIEVPLPSYEDRAIIFKKYITQSKYKVENRLKTEKFYQEFARKTALFSGADIREAIQKAALKAAYNNQKNIKIQNIREAIESIHEKKHIELRRDKFAPEKSMVRLDELAGTQTKRIQLLLKQLKDPDKFRQLGASVPKAVLLYGPPGTGKTTLVRAIANFLDANLFQLSGPDIESGYRGGATENVGRLFANARKMAKCSQKPSVILIDEMDGAISSSTRREIIAKLKFELTEANNNVYIFATTNHLHYFPAALIRPGRFEKIEFPLPSEADRIEIFKKYAIIYKTEKKVKAKSFCEEVAKRTEGFNCAEIADILEKAAQEAALNDQHVVQTQNILVAIEIIQKGKKTDRGSENKKSEDSILTSENIQELDQKEKATLLAKLRAFLQYIGL